MTDLTAALKDFVSLFERMAIPYAVMGGMAIRIYGIPRPTYDIDFTLAIDRSRLGELFSGVQALGCTVPEEYLRGWVDNVAEMPILKFRLYLENRGIDIDVFLAQSRFQEEILTRRRRELIDDRAVWLVSPEDLILLKLLANRPRDLADIGDVLFTQGELDVAHMRHWANQLGLLARLEDVLAHQSDT